MNLTEVTWPTAKGKRYLLELSYDLDIWYEVIEIEAEVDGVETLEFDRLGEGEPRRFYRLRLAH